MSQFFFKNTESDEYGFPPYKKTINSFQDETACLSPYGPVSSINCPKSDPYCECPIEIQKLKPGITGIKNASGAQALRGVSFSAEPSDAELAELKNQTNECNLIYNNLGIDWFGIDYSDPHSSFNCTNCVNTENQTGFELVKEPGDNWRLYTGITGQDGKLQADSLFFNYDRRLKFGISGPNETVIFKNFPRSITGAAAQNLDCGRIIGPYFKYYKEYSKTYATFWNTPPKTPLYRKAQTALMSAQRVKILVHGNFNIKPGTMININYHNFGGRWMVYKVQRIITTQKHSMYLYLMRDGGR